ncbi:4-hydroxy-tetrahydrodipicolinate synthase [Knoellia remsis]|uniref:4-hydroxy-tetrahydrodipicolinate synthase n=1 Tax=Knoellia remsis TaxID=407159 RepID=A0A2T0V193_9MICO|nr:dihydrodipicolinate synthase family protein [Knoellia remsis]PRY63848.1 4-hydroxy-tetrahydrodipicolinate synthase [Knoellia remsis]
MSTSRSPRGLVPVLQLPFHADQSIDLTSFDRLVDDTLSHGVGGVFFPGIASEFYTLDDSERALLTQRLVTRTRDLDDVLAVVSITDQSTVTVLRRAHEALEWGADLVNIMTPRFWPLPASAVEDFVDEVLADLAPAPVMIQHASDVSTVSLGPARLQEWARRHPNLVSVKVEVDRPGPFIGALVHGDPPLDALVGRSGLHLMDALDHDTSGVQPVTGFVEVYAAILRAWHDGRRGEARDLYQRLLPYIIVWESEPGLMISVAKEVAFRRGLLDTAVCRSPAPQLTPDLHASVEAFLDEFTDLLAPVGARR